MSITIKGRTIMGGNVQAEAVVSKTPLSLTYINPDTGAVDDSTQELNGQIIKGKILVLPALKGSAQQPFSLYQLVQNGVAPQGLIALEADARLMAAAMFCDIPLMDEMQKNPLEVISTGDIVHLNADRGVVEVQK